MQPGVPAETVAQRQASQRQAAERPLPLPDSGADAFVRCRRGPKVRKAGANAPSLPVGSEGPKGGHQCSVVAGGVRRTERRAPMLPSVAGETRRSEDRQGTAPSGRVLAGKCPCRSALRRKHSCESVTETSFAGSPLAGASSAGSARVGGFSRERPCGRVLAGAPVREGSRGSARAGGFPRKRPGKCPEKRPGCAPEAIASASGVPGGG